jgi:hypothetical protein
LAPGVTVGGIRTRRRRPHPALTHPIDWERAICTALCTRYHAAFSGVHVHLLGTAMALHAGTCASSSWTQGLTGVPRDRRVGDSCLRDGPVA